MFSILIAGTMVCAGVWLFTGQPANGSADTSGERWVNANHLQVQVDGKWHDIHMMPLSEQLCDSKHRLFRRYCD